MYVSWRFFLYIFMLCALSLFLTRRHTHHTLNPRRVTCNVYLLWNVSYHSLCSLSSLLSNLLITTHFYLFTGEQLLIEQSTTIFSYTRAIEWRRHSCGCTILNQLIMNVSHSERQLKMMQMKTQGRETKSNFHWLEARMHTYISMNSPTVWEWEAFSHTSDAPLLHSHTHCVRFQVNTLIEKCTFDFVAGEEREETCTLQCCSVLQRMLSMSSVHRVHGFEEQEEEEERWMEESHACWGAKIETG